MIKRISRKTLIMAISLAALILTTAAVTLAYIVATTPPVNNDFTPAVVSCSVTDTDGERMSGVAVKNTGNVDSYVRAIVIVNWVSESDGSVYAPSPALATDYSIDFGHSAYWHLGSDGFYYYTAPVGASQSTDLLISQITQITAAPEGCKLSVNVIAQSVQATPIKAATELWGITILDNGHIYVR